MKNPLFVLSLLLICSLLTACSDDGGDSGCPEFKSTDYNLTIQEEYVTAPGKVSVFFKVDDRNGLPIAGLTAEDFHIYEKGRNDDCFNAISSFESNARISPNSQIFAYNTMLVLDLSGSVIENSFTELKQASISFIENIMPETPVESVQMGIWWFDGENELHELSDFISNRSSLIDLITNLDSTMSTDPSTDLYGAVLKSTDIASDVLEELLEDDIIASSAVVLFTDGTDQAARYTKEEAIMEVEEADENVSFFTIGLGNEIDQDVLKSIGTTSSIIAENKEQLEERFVEVSQLVFDEANSYYLFEYCSPKRDGSGTSELAIEVDYQNKRGSVITSFDATGFTSGCN